MSLLRLSYLVVAAALGSKVSAQLPAPFQLTVDFDPSAAVTGDFNNDGITDFVVVGQEPDGVIPFLGNGDGSYRQGEHFPVQWNPYHLTAADFNLDGNLDVATENFNSNTVSILLGRGDGTFDPEQRFSVGTVAEQIVSADFNGDGKPDIATSNRSSEDISILLGNGDGTFSPQTRESIGVSLYGLLAADFNGDGSPDLVTASGSFSSTKRLYVLLGNGDGTFGAFTSYPLLRGGGTLSAADFNLDGNLDVAATNRQRSEVSLYFGNGNGTFGGEVRITVDGLSPIQVTSGDVNGDGIPDLAGVTNEQDQVFVMRGNGDGTFGAPELFPVGDGAGSGITAGQLDGQGGVDLITANGLSTQDPSVSILQGTPVIVAKPVSAAEDGGSVQVEIATTKASDDPIQGTWSTADFSALSGIDYTGVGNQTFTIPAGETSTLATIGLLSDSVAERDEVFTVELQSSGGRAVAVSGVPVTIVDNDDHYDGTNLVYGTGSGPKGIVVADFNQDGKPDIATSNDFSGNVSVLMGNGDGTFQDDVLFDVGDGPEDIVTGYFNADSYPDLATANGSSDDVSVLLGNGSSFSLAGNFSVGDFPMFIRSADFDGDGRDDLVAGNVTTRDLSVLIGTGTGAFGIEQRHALAGSLQGVTLADFNADNRIDIVAGRINSGTFEMLRGQGNGAFAAAEQILGSSVDSITSGDFDGDGNIDVAGAFRGNLILRFGNGDGTFAPEIAIPSSDGPDSMAVFDVDKNGFPDIVTGDSYWDDLTLHLSNGDGTFQGPRYLTIAKSDPSALAGGDFDGDGLMDLAVAHSSGGVSIYLNQFDGSSLTFPEIGIEQPAGVSLTHESSEVDFGSAEAESTGSSRTFTVRNQGQATLVLAGARIAGDHPGDFLLDVSGMAGSLAPGASTTFSVTFSPVLPGNRSATLRVFSTDTDENPFEISLSGTSTPPPRPEITVEHPASVTLATGSGAIDFGAVTVGGSGAARTFRVRNDGGVNLSLSTPTNSGGNAGDFLIDATGLSTTLLPGETTTFRVRFSPGDEGPRSTALRISSNDADENPFEISLTGNAVAEPVIGLTGFSPGSLQRGQSSITATITGENFDLYPSSQLRVYLGTGVVLEGTTPAGNAQPASVDSGTLQIVVNNVYADTPLGFRDVILRYGEGADERITLPDAFEVVDSPSPIHTYSGVVTENGGPKPGATVDLLRNGAVYRTATTDTNGRYSMNFPAPLPAGDYAMVPRASGQTIYDPASRPANYTTSFYQFNFAATESGGGTESMSILLNSNPSGPFVEGTETVLTVTAGGLSGPLAAITSATILAVDLTHGESLTIPLYPAEDPLTHQTRFTFGDGTWRLQATVGAISNGRRYSGASMAVHEIVVTEPVALPPVTRAHPESDGDLMLQLHGVAIRGSSRSQRFFGDRDEFVAELLRLPEGVNAPPGQVRLVLKEADLFGQRQGYAGLEAVLRKAGGSGPNGGTLYTGRLTVPASALGNFYRATWSWETDAAIVSGAFEPVLIARRLLDAVWAGNHDGGTVSPGQSQTLSFYLRDTSGVPVGDFGGELVLGEEQRLAVENLRLVDARRGRYEGVVTYPTSEVMGRDEFQTLRLLSEDRFDTIRNGPEITIRWQPEIPTGVAKIETLLTTLDTQIENAFFQLGRIVSENDRSIQSGMGNNFPLYDEALSPALQWGGRVHAAGDFLELWGYGDRVVGATREVQQSVDAVLRRTNGLANQRWSLGTVLEGTDIGLSLVSLIVDSAPRIPVDRSDRLTAYFDEALKPAVLGQMRLEMERIRESARGDFPNLNPGEQLAVLEGIDIYTRRLNQLAAGISQRGTALQEELNWTALEVIETRAWVDLAQSALLMGKVAAMTWGPASLMGIASKQVSSEIAGIVERRLTEVVDAKAAILWEFHFLNCQFLSDETQRLVADATFLLRDVRNLTAGRVAVPTYHEDITVTIEDVEVAPQDFDSRDGSVDRLYTRIRLTNTSDEPISVLFEYARAFGHDLTDPPNFLDRVVGLPDHQYGVLVKGASVDSFSAPSFNSIVVRPGFPKTVYIPHINRDPAIEGLPDQVRNFRMKRDESGNRELTAKIKFAAAPASGLRPYLDLYDPGGEPLFTSSWSELESSGAASPLKGVELKEMSAGDDPLLRQLMITREIRLSERGLQLVQRIVNTGATPVTVSWRQEYPPGFALIGDSSGAEFGADESSGAFALEPNAVRWLGFQFSGRITPAGISFPSLQIRGEEGSYLDYFDENLTIEASDAVPLLLQLQTPREIDASDGFEGVAFLRSAGQIEGGFVLAFERLESEGQWTVISSSDESVPDFGTESVDLIDASIPEGRQVLTYRVTVTYDGAVVLRQAFTATVRADQDNDGMDDFWEDANGLDSGADDSGQDPDGDGLSNGDEYSRTTDPQVADTDGDGLNDGVEVQIHLTSPLSWDSDFGGLSDGFEIAQTLDPLDRSDDRVEITLGLPSTLIGGQDRFFVTWSSSLKTDTTDFEVRFAESPEALETVVPITTKAEFLQWSGLSLDSEQTYHLRVTARVDGQPVASASGELHVHRLPVLTIDDITGAMIHLSAEGTDGFFDLMFSSDLSDWEKVETIFIQEGSGAAAFDSQGNDGYFFQLKHPY